VEKLIRAIKGFVSYFGVRTADGRFSVSVYQDNAGADESVRVARDWIGKNAGHIGAAAPTVSEGTVILHFRA
jgi:predicted ATP-dependent Lon-type protease